MNNITTKKASFLLASMALSLLISCSSDKSEKPTGQTEEPTNTEWKLVWSDEFDTDGLPDPKKWSYDTEGNAWGWGNNEAQHYTSGLAENAKVANGHLVITALKQKTEDKEYSSARLRTKGTGDWLYGKFEIRAKVPAGRGTWSAIWMLPTDWAYGDWPASGEIDIMEHVGYDGNNVVASSHSEAYNHKIGTQKTVTTPCPSATTEFHTYTLEWEASEYRIYIDNTLSFTYKNDGTGFKSWPFDKRFHLLINLAIGGDWGGSKGIDPSIFPAVYEIDWVRVYQK